MKSLSKYQKRALAVFLAVNLGIVAVSVVYTLFMNQLTESGKYVCRFQELFRLYCPGCGGSRSVKSLLKFDLVAAFLSYPPMLVMLAIFVALDTRLLISLIKDDFSVVLRFKLNTLILIPVAILLHFFVRNILLLSFGIDYLGDIIPHR